MKDYNPIADELIAPCGMNCAICSRYLSHLNHLKRSQCSGCRPRKQKCDYLFAKCTGINHGKSSGFEFCYLCDQFPCKEIRRMDKRYRKNYKMSVRDNLETIKGKGIESFIDDQYRQYRCIRCGGLISIHNRKCFNCDSITRLVEKE